MSLSRAISVAATILVLASSSISCSEPRLPDLFLLNVDTLRADHLGLHGYGLATSPRLDEFASGALVFDQAIAPSSWTLPSVGSVFTGVMPSIHGLVVRAGDDRQALSPSLQTLAEVLSGAGYQTIAIVTNPWITGRHGLDRGFDRFVPAVSADAAEVHELARQELEQAGEGPVFLYLHYMDVHGPYEPADASVRAELGPLPEAQRRPLTAEEVSALPTYLVLPDAERLEDYVYAYDAGIRAWDHAFGEWLDWMAETDRWADAAVIVTADHGEELLDHGGWNHGETLFQEQVRVPLLVRADGWTPRREQGVRSLLQLPTTILAMAGIESPMSVAPPGLRQDPGAAVSETEVTLQGVPGDSQVAIVDGALKLVRRNDHMVCYDLASDPEEADQLDASRCGDLAGRLQRHTAVSERLRRDLEDGGSVTLDADALERLRALGYIQ